MTLKVIGAFKGTSLSYKLHNVLLDEASGLPHSVYCVQQQEILFRSRIKTFTASLSLIYQQHLKPFFYGCYRVYPIFFSVYLQIWFLEI